MSPTATPRRTRLGGLLRFGWRAGARVRRPMERVVGSVARPVARPLLALAGPVRVPLALATAPLGRAATQVHRPLVALRHGGLDLSPGALADLLDRTGTATGRLLVLVPASGRDEAQWERGREATGATYAERLQQLHDWTPVHTRLDHGPATESGLELASLLQRLVEAWPVDVERIAVLTAGDGGLVVRAACAVRVPAGVPWATRVSEVVGLGVPRYATGPSRLSSDVGRRLDEELAGIVVADAAYLGLEPAAEIAHLLVSERAALGPHPVGAALGRILWWRHRRGARPRHVVDLFPAAEAFELPPDGPLTNRGDLHDALLRWLA